MPFEWKFAVSGWLLTVLYIIPMALCWYWRIRRNNFSQNRVSSFWRNIFTIMMILGTFCRATFWFIQPFHVSKLLEIHKLINAYWSIFPGLFICTDYLVILFLWIQIYHSNEDNPIDIKPYFLYILGIIYMISFSLMLGDFITFAQPKGDTKIPTYESPLQRTIILFMASLYLLASLGYVGYGVRFYQRLSRRPLLQVKVKTDILPRVVVITILCGVCFTLRAILVIVDSYFDLFMKLVGNSDFYWWLDPAYYIPLEILPLLLMLKLFTPQEEEDTPNDISMDERRYQSSR